MTIIIAYRRRGSTIWTHFFRVRPCEWKSFRRHARLYRHAMVYARIVHGEYVEIL